ncbi:hypothetical protein F8R90_09355 [Nostoc sp. NZL]|nr:hypothetical protein [Nostoc sp. NZL]
MYAIQSELSLNLSPKRRETLNFPPSRRGKGVRGLGFSLAFSDDQIIMNYSVNSKIPSTQYTCASAGACFPYQHETFVHDLVAPTQKSN